MKNVNSIVRAIAEEKGVSRQILVSLVSEPRKVGAVEVLPYTHFLDLLWGGELTA